MPKRYEDRYGRGGHRRDRDRAEDRGYMNRAGDEVRSWFGDDDAERRRRMDEQRDHERERRYGSDWDRSNQNRSDWMRSDRDRDDWNRPDWNRSESRYDWNRPEGIRSQSQSWRGSSQDDSSRHQDWGRNWSGSPESNWDRERSQYYRESHRDNPMNRYGGSTWSADEGRMEFGGAAPAYGPYASGVTRESRDYRVQDTRSQDTRSHENRSVEDRWGRGPKGYQRADNRIHEDVCDRLTYSEVDAENIEVTVSGGEVTLSGTVRDRWDKRRAEDVVEQVSGVRDVHNNIRVHRADRGIGQSTTSTSDQPGTVLGVNPTSSSHITNTPPTGNKR